MLKLKQFDEFLAATDDSVRDMGWIMVSNTYNVSVMHLKDLCLFKLEIEQDKYNYILNNFYYFNDFKSLYNKNINERLKIYSKISKEIEFQLAKNIINKQNE